MPRIPSGSTSSASSSAPSAAASAASGTTLKMTTVNGKKVLTNADIVLMTQDHFDDDTLIQVIKVSQTDFDISGDALVKLKDEGVSTAVIRAMLQAAENNKHASASIPSLTASSNSLGNARLSP